MKNKQFLISATFIMYLITLVTGCAVTGGTLLNAALEGQTNVVKEYINKGADVNARGACDWRWDSDVTALSCAAYGGHLDTVKFLIEKGADVNVQSRSGWTPLMSAAYTGHDGVAKLLIESGADVDVAMANLAKWGPGSNGLIFLQRLAKNKQPSRQQPQAIAINKSQKLEPASKSDVDELPFTNSKLNKNAYAVVIGIEQYRQNLPKADYAVQDAQTVTSYLTHVLGYPEENVITLLNDRASYVDLAKYFERWLPNNVEKDSIVFIYYSGHGAPNLKTGGAYLVPYDGDPSFLDQTGYSLKKMYDVLGTLPAKEIIVALDSCFSGAGGRSVIAKGSRPLVINLQDTVVLPKNMMILSASSGDEISSTYDEKGHGLFTYFMLKGIRTENVVKEDGSIKIDNLFSYIKPNVTRVSRKKYNNEQTPQLIMSGKGK